MSIYNLINYNNHSNLLLYNNYKNVLNNLKSKFNDKHISIKTFLDIEYTETKTYHHINKYKNRINLIKFIKSICFTDNYYVNTNKYIIIENITDYYIQNCLRVIIEKYKHIKYIIAVDNLFKIIESIRSRFICIRCPLDNYYDIYNSFNNIEITDYLKHKYQSREYIEQLIETNNTDKSDLIDIIINYILKIDKLDKIREISYLTISSGVPMITLIKRLLKQLLNDNRIINSKKYKLVQIFAIFDIDYKKAYYKTIHFEKLLLEYKNIIK
jgi:hypothetical protein